MLLEVSKFWAGEGACRVRPKQSQEAVGVGEHIHLLLS